MNKKGFTLVELLAVIVILSLLALLTSTAVTKLVKEAKNELSVTQIELIKSSAETWGAENLNRLPSAGECSYLTLEDLKNYGLLDNKILDPKNNEDIPNDLKIKITTTLSKYGNPTTDYEVNPESIEGCVWLYEPVCTYADVDNSNTLNLSDIVTCATESFYVMENDGVNVTMLSKYNLNVGNNPYPSGELGIQNENVFGWKSGYTTYGTLSFSTNNYWSSNVNNYPSYIYNNNSLLYSYINEYELYLKNSLKLTTAAATLMSLEQANALRFNKGNPSWLYNSSYWLGNVASSTLVYYIEYPENLVTAPFDVNSTYGVRPVVTIKTYHINF